MAKNIIEARVRQKKDTLDNWMANTLVLFSGEQAFVVNDEGMPVNFKIGDGTKTFAELPFWIDYSQAAFTPYVESPSQEVAFTIVGEGTYGSIVVAAGYLGILSWDGSSWALSDEVELPSNLPIGIKSADDLNATSGKEMYYKNSDRISGESVEALLTANPVDIVLNRDNDLIGYIDINGDFITTPASGLFRVYEFIDVYEGSDIFIQYNSFSATGSPRGMWGYDEDDNPIVELVGSVNYSADGHIVTIPIGLGITKIRGTFHINSPLIIRRTDVNIPIQSVSGLYDILQKTTPVVIGTSVGYIDANGDALSSSNWRCSDFIPVTVGSGYAVLGNTALTSSAYLVTGYNAIGEKISTIRQSWDSQTQGKFLFNITDINITQVRISSHISVELEFFTVGLITADDLSGLAELGNTVNLLQNNGGHVMPVIWGAIGHSIWWQDERPYGGVGEPAKGTQSWLREKIQFNGYNKYAYSGNSLGMLTEPDTSSILQSTKVSTWSFCDVYTYDSITNDFKRNIPIGLQSDFLDNTGATTYYGALRVLHDTLLALNPVYKMICSNSLKRSNAGYTSWSANTEGYTLTDYSVALEWVSNRLSWKFIDQFRDSGISDDNLGELTLDGLHPNDTGYEYYYNLWLQKFKEL